MITKRHSLEPWKKFASKLDEKTVIWYGRYGIVSAVASFEREEDAERAIACVNACAGMGDPESTIKNMRYELDRFRAGTKDAKSREIAELKDQRDELILALFDALESTEYYSSETAMTIGKFEALYNQMSHETPPQRQ